MVRLSREAVPKRVNSREGLYSPLLRLLLYDTTAMEFWMSKSLPSHKFVVQFWKIKRDNWVWGSCFCLCLGIASYLATAFNISKIGNQSKFSADCFENIAQNTVRYLYTEQHLSWFQPFWAVLSLRNSIGFFFNPPSAQSLIEKEFVSMSSLWTHWEIIVSRERGQKICAAYVQVIYIWSLDWSHYHQVLSWFEKNYIWNKLLVFMLVIGDYQYFWTEPTFKFSVYLV